MRAVLVEISKMDESDIALAAALLESGLPDDALDRKRYFLVLAQFLLAVFAGVVVDPGFLD